MKRVSSIVIVLMLTIVSPALAAETEIKPVELSKSSQGQGLGDMTPVIAGLALIGAAAAAVALAGGGGSSTTATTGTTP